MKIGFKKVEFILVAILYLSALYIWTLPLHNNKMPFGDVDASSHFTIGDYIITYDKSIAKIPYPITFRYKGQNDLFPDYLWYPPQYWTSTGIAQVLGNERLLPVFIIVAVFSSLIILSSYFLIRSLFGFWPAFLSSFLLIFSTRDYMIYLWGQWPQSLSFAFTPLVLYCFFQYYKESQSKPIYIYFMAVFLSGQFFFHPQGMIASIAALMIFILLIAIKGKKLPFRIKHLIIPIILFAFISAAFAPLNVGEFFTSLSEKQSDVKSYQFDKLFKWYQGIKNDPGLPDFYFTYNKTHGSLQNGLLSWWTLPFLLIGLLAMAYRRKKEDLLMLSWFASFYFLTRLVVFGLGTRDIRMFAYEAHVLYPIIAIGLLSISSFPISSTFNKYLKYGLIAVFLILAVTVNGKSAYDVLEGQQYSIGRINPWQLEAADWIRSNLEADADIYAIGTFGYEYFGAKVKWLNALSQRHFLINREELIMTDYIFFDYTDAILLRNQNYMSALQGIEKNFANATAVYDKNNIKVYKVAGIQI